MLSKLPRSRIELIEYIHDPLLRNSVFMMLASMANVGFGFVFWILAARIYSNENIGIAAALISAMSLLVLSSRFGLDYSLIRFFPQGNRRSILSTSVIITACAALIMALVLIAGMDIFSNELKSLQEFPSAVLFTIVVATNSMVAIAGNAFVAGRKASHFFIQSLVMGTRIILLLPVIAFGAMGIFSAVGISYLLSLIVSIILLNHMGLPISSKIDLSYLRKSLRYSAANYASSLFIAGPALVMPLIVINLFGAENAAYYYAAYSVAALLFIVPNAISISLFVEGSHGVPLEQSVRKATAFLIPGIAIPATLLFLYGEFFLGVFGEEYAQNGFSVMRILVIASMFVGFVYLYYSMARVQERIISLVYVSGGIFVSLLITARLFSNSYGLDGMGYAWLCSYIVGAVLISISSITHRLGKGKSNNAEETMPSRY